MTYETTVIGPIGASKAMDIMILKNTDNRLLPRAIVLGYLVFTEARAGKIRLANTT